jgi:hypothetical protein
VRIPAPRPGLVIRDAFLWSHERDAGADEAAKERPCAVVVATPGGLRTIVAPITNLQPEDPSASIEIPNAVCRALGLDEGRHWLRVEELNRFVWPGYDLRPIPRRPETCVYGMLPRGLFEQFREAIVARQRSRSGRTQRRE